jgi:hypothetical protein
MSYFPEREIMMLMMMIRVCVNPMKVKYIYVPVPKYYAMKTGKGNADNVHTFLTSAVDGGEWLVSRFGRSKKFQ